MKVLFCNATILTIDEKNTIIKNGFLGVSGKTISFVGEKIPDDFKPDRVIETHDGILMPGLINCHCHSPMTMFRNYTSGLPLKRWLFERNKPLQQYVTEADIVASADLAYIEMIKSGTTTVADMYMWSDVVCERICKAGLRALVSGPYNWTPEKSAEKLLDRALRYADYLEAESNGRVKESNYLHSVYSVSDEVIAFVTEFSRLSGMPVQLHASETRWENEEVKKRFNGATAFEVLERFGILDFPVIAAHCVHLSERDKKIMQAHQVYPVHCPSSNLYLGSGIANVPSMMEHGLTVCLGTDGAGSNNTLNMLQELHLAAILHKGAQEDATLVTATQAIRMATINGAKAVGLDNMCGSLEPGKRADLIMLDTRSPNMTPVVDARNAVAYSAQGNDVSLTMVDGQILMENRRLINMDEEKVREDAAAASARVLAHGCLLP